MGLSIIDASLETSREQDGDNNVDKATAMDESVSDSDSSRGSDDGEEGESTRSVFREILEDLKSSAKNSKAMSGDLNLADETDLKEFFGQKATHLDKKGGKDMTLLHMIAEAPKNEMPEVKHMKGLIKGLVKLDANLLAERDHDGKTPLFCAIMNKNRRLVKAMYESHKDINSILGMGKSKNPKSTNCIHEAIIKKSSHRDDKLLVELIGKAQANTLCALDENGLTPLHLAVEYKRCDDAQLDVVKALVEKCDEALDKTYQHPELGDLSPYAYHELTYKQSQRDTNTLETKKRSEKMDLESSSKRDRFGRKEDFKELKSMQFKERSRDHSMSQKVHFPQQPGIVSTQAEVPTGKGGPKPIFAHQDKEDTSAQTISDSRSKDFASASKEKEKGVSKRNDRSKVIPTRTSASEIKRFLKLHYLRNRSHNDAVRFLYGVKQERQIYFDLFGTSSDISKIRLIEGLHHLQLEDILQYVAVPCVRIEDEQPGKLKSGQVPPKPDGNGRTDMKILFQWLKKDKEVKTMLKVIVDDLKQPAHSDEAIEACLAGMGVETWDWRKIDLSPEVIQHVAPMVRVVHLYWSGNNAVLRGWSAPDGLKALQELRRVHLYVHQGLETRNRVMQNVAKFKKDVEDGTPIRVTEPSFRNDATDSMHKGTCAIRDPYERHKWIDSMERFADFLQTAERNVELPPRRPITVAIIDDGVDINDPNLHSRIQGGTSFCRRDEDQNLNNPYYVSPGGHGTAMARLICKICPNVRLYILRLDEYDGDQGKRTITANSAAKAVRAAIEEKVDIISMSWTIEKTEKNDSDITQLGNAICTAAEKDILMFCAAADQGVAIDRTYPAASDTKKLFKIGAAEAAGSTYKWVGDSSLVDFIFPGHQVVTERHDDPRVKNYSALTGSSVATALASALAAVILDTVQIGGIWRDHTSGPNGNLANKYRLLKEHDNMDKVFAHIGITENKYIKVWERFLRKVKDAESDGAARDTYIDYIAALADQLTSQL